QGELDEALTAMVAARAEDARQQAPWRLWREHLVRAARACPPAHAGCCPPVCDHGAPGGDARPYLFERAAGVCAVVLSVNLSGYARAHRAAPLSNRPDCPAMQE